MLGYGGGAILGTFSSSDPNAPQNKLMASFTCSLWWFLAGIVVGWLLNWLLWRMIRRDPQPARSYGATGSGGQTGATSRPAAPTPSAPQPAASPVIDIAAAAAAGFRPGGPDDLTVIEGIGPKINALLDAAGIRTFTQLATSDVTVITAILERGGAHFNLANPVTWPEQATLAATNRWAELKALQDRLYGGTLREDSHGGT